MPRRSASGQLCFVDMPFGKKPDPQSGIEIDFDQIYQRAIKPAVEAERLTCLRGDEESTGGIIHRAMFARLLLSEFVIADLTTANANVFYELGVRHAARPYTTIPIFATISAPPFDVNMVRAIPYQLKKGKLSADSARQLREGIQKRIRAALDGPVTRDSPLFELFDRFPGIEISHELTEVFQDRVQRSGEFERALRAALESEPRAEARQRVEGIERELGDLKALEYDILVKLLLAYRDVSAWDRMIELAGRFPAPLQAAPMVRQQLALALNRRAGPGDRDEAVRILTDLLRTIGPSAETFGILGRVYKDLYKEAQREGSPESKAHLDEAIDAYRKGFEAEPADYYPGVNAISLLLLKGTDEAQREAERLTPLVSFAVARRGGAASADYWDRATVLELALIGRDYELAENVLPRVLAAARYNWRAKTTADNLELLLNLRKGKENTAVLEKCLQALRKKERELPGSDG